MDTPPDNTTCRLGIPRIYLPAPLHTGATVALDAQAAQHLVRVLRLKPGASLIVFNGQGGEYEATLENTQHGAATVRVERFIARDAESPLTITLAQGISRGERMDYAVQKAVELGVNRIVPLVTDYCVVTLHKEREEKRLAHWRGVIVAACEQCGRTRIPTLSNPQSLHAWLNEARNGLRLLFDPYSTQHLAQLAPPQDEITLLIGPEGGLSDAENAAARAAGFSAVRLGPRMLRTETAPAAALAAVQALWGDLG
ncbi:MAG: 16S rRNA (uracil(1498)-N(3))-methyltransferase [Pseudomonadota bacterium]